MMMANLTEYCNKKLSINTSRSISKEKGRRIVHVLKYGKIPPPLPDSKAPWPLDARNINKFFHRHNFSLKSDTALGIVDEPRATEEERVS